jgi:hypothetical protein
MSCPLAAHRGNAAGSRTATASRQIVPEVLGTMMRDKDPARVRRANEAMLRMVKLDIGHLEEAYRGASAA